MSSRFIYVHDPMCSWCWAHKPQWTKLSEQLSEFVSVEYRVGGLAPDSDEPMPKALQQSLISYWQKIHDEYDRPFNFDFWTKNQPRRSTYPACRAVLAARRQHQELAMITALQEAYYLRALNPSDVDVHHQLAKELGLNVEVFKKDIKSSELQTEFEDEIAFSRALPIQGFPSMVLIHNEMAHSIVLNYRDASGALAQVKSILGI